MFLEKTKAALTCPLRSKMAVRFAAKWLSAPQQGRLLSLLRTLTLFFDFGSPPEALDG